MTRPTALITAATAGIGFHTAAALARAGMRVLVTGRDELRGRRAVSQLQSHAGHADVELIVADGLSIRENVFVANEAAHRGGRVDVLVNNVGGAGFAERQETAEGLEATMALNFVGPFALTTELLRSLPAPPRRIVNVISSAFAMWTRDPFEDLEGHRDYVALHAYGHAKLLNLLFTMALVRRLASTWFTGAAIYITAVEHPARLSCGTEIAATEWAPSYKRATVMQVPLALVAGVFGLIRGALGGGPQWIVAAVLILLVVPFTLIVIRPTNNRLLDPRRDRGSNETRELLATWGRLHLVRTVLSLAASVIYVWATIH